MIKKTTQFAILIGCLCTIGCSSTNSFLPIKRAEKAPKQKRLTKTEQSISEKKSIMSSYLSRVSKFDGIDQDEAILIAQSELIFRGLQEKYYIDNPLFQGIDRNYWSIKFRPVNKTLGQSISNYDMIIYVHQGDGQTLINPRG